VHRVRLHLDKEWVRKPDKPDAPPVRLDLKPGKHAVRAAYLFEQPDPKDGPLRVVSPVIEMGAAAGPFDEVRLVTEAGPVPLLYVVLTHPKADHTALEGLVVQHAAAALAEADRRTFQAGNIVFLVRDKPGDERGYVTGFSREQLDEIQKAAPADARRLAGGHAWRSTGPLPAGK